MAVGSKIIFEDFSGKITKEIEDTTQKWLLESGNELASQVAMRTGQGAYTSQIAQEWTCIVDKEKYMAIVGNPLENALWEEFGTGEYALNGDGRKGYWVYVKDSNNNKSKSETQYTLKEAKRAVAYLRSKGLEAYYTCGKKPRRCLHHAFANNEETIKEQLRNQLRSMK